MHTALSLGLPLALAIALLSGAAASSQEATQTPTRKPGWWEIQMTVAGATAKLAHPTMRLCTDPAIDAVQPPFGVHVGQACPPVQITRTATGWDIHAACTTGGAAISAEGHASGDLNSRYSVELVTRMNPAPAPEAAETHVHMDATWLGPCPAGKKPGDLDMTMNVAPGAKPGAAPAH